MKMRRVNEIVVDLAINPAVQFHPTIAALFEAVPDDAPDDLRPGYRYAGGVWTPPQDETPAPSTPDAVYRTVMTPIRFKAQFSVQEQVAIKRARAYDGTDEDKAFQRDALSVLFDSLDDPRLTEVDVTDPAVRGGLAFCRTIGILTTMRVDEIERGVEVSA